MILLKKDWGDSLPLKFEEKWHGDLAQKRSELHKMIKPSYASVICFFILCFLFVFLCFIIFFFFLFFFILITK